MAEGETIERETADSPVKTIGRAAKILTILAGAEASGMMLTEIARQADFGKGTTHRCSQHSWMPVSCSKIRKIGRYRLGRAARAFRASQPGAKSGFPRAAHPRKACAGDRRHAFCSIREGLHAVCIARRDRAVSNPDADPRYRASPPAWRRRGQSRAACRAAPGGDRRHDRKKRGGHRRPPDPCRKRPADDGAEARRYGYALNDANIIPGMSAVGYAVRGKDGGPIASLSIASIRERVQGRASSNSPAYLSRQRLTSLPSSDQPATCPDHLALGTACITKIRWRTTERSR